MKILFRMKWGVLALIIAMTFVFASCELGGKDDDRTALFTNHAEYSIRIRNHSSYNLVAFAGDVSASNLIGGVPRNSGEHGFPRKTSIFTSDPNYFRMAFITEDDYNTHKNNLSAANNLVITSMFVFWNGNAGENTKVYEIAHNMGGGNKFLLYNPTNFDVEIRINGSQGPTLGFAPKGMATTMLYSSDLEIIAFPVFILENRARDIVETIIPMMDTAQFGRIPFRTTLNFESDEGIQAMNIQDIVGSLSDRSAGASYINVVNQLASSVGGIAFVRSNVIQTTVTGTRYFSGSKEFRIDMEKFGDEYQKTRTISGLSIETGGQFIPVTAVHDTSLRSFVINTDMVYTVNVVGNWLDGIFATIEVRIPGEGEAPYPDGPIPMTFSLTGW